MATHTLFAESDLAVGEKRKVVVEGEKILICRLGDGYFAIQNNCTHMGVALTKGKVIDDSLIQCPFHRARFDIRTGKVADWANFPPGVQLLNAIRGEKDLKTYPVNIEDGQVTVDVSHFQS